MDLVVKTTAAQTGAGSWWCCWGRDDTEGESRPLTRDQAVEAPQRSYMRRILELCSHPIANPILILGESFLVGYCASSLKLPD